MGITNFNMNMTFEEYGIIPTPQFGHAFSFSGDYSAEDAGEDSQQIRKGRRTPATKAIGMR